MKIVIDSEDYFFGKAFEVILEEFMAQKGKTDGRLRTTFKILSMTMDNLTIIWSKIVNKREDGLYEFTLEDLNDANKELVDKIAEVALKHDDTEFGMLYSLTALTASGIIKRIGNAITGENNDDAGN